MLKRKNNLKLERLESREMLASNLSAVLVGTLPWQAKTLRISEPIAQNSILSIKPIGSNIVRFDGRDAFNVPQTRINGQPFIDVQIPLGGLNVEANLGAGNDNLSILPGTRLKRVVLNVGGPGADFDNVNINGLVALNGVDVTTGPGLDSVVVEDSRVVSGNLSINSGAGPDNVRVGSLTAFVEVKGTVNVQSFTVNTEADADRVTLNSVFALSLFARTGGGNDTIEGLNGNVGQQLTIGAGWGNDVVSLQEMTSEQNFSINLGSDNDSLNMVYLRANTLTINAGTGFDTLTSSIPGPVGTKTISGFEMINGRRIVSQFPLPVIFIP